MGRTILSMLVLLSLIGSAKGGTFGAVSRGV